MRRFTDSHQRDWSVSITVATAKRVRDLAGADILDLSSGGVFERLWADIVLVGEVLHAVCLPEITERGLSQEEFLEGLSGDSAEAARTALMDEIVSFTPDPRLRQALARVVQQARGQQAMEIERILTQDGPSSGDAPGSSASTLDR